MTIYDAKIGMTEKRNQVPVSYLLIEAVVLITLAMVLVSFFSR